MKEQNNKTSDELIAWAMITDPDNAYDERESNRILEKTGEAKKQEIRMKMKRGDIVLPGNEFELYVAFLNRE